MQKLPYKFFSFNNISLDDLLNTDNDSDYGYWVLCDI